MIIVDPVTLGDAACTRPSPKWVYDRTGTLVEVPANTLGVTYDPSDLSKAPYALVEPAGTNRLRYSEQFDSTAWGKANGIVVMPAAAIAPNGEMVAQQLREPLGLSNFFMSQSSNVTAGEVITLSVYALPGPGDRELALIFTNTVGELPIGTNQIVAFDLLNLAAAVIAGQPVFEIERLANGYIKCSITAPVLADGVVAYQLRPARGGSIAYAGDGESGNYIWGAMLMAGRGSYIRTADTPVTRAADVIGPTAGLIYSNVSMVEPPYDAAVTYAKDALVRDPVTHGVYKSLIDTNKGKSLTDEASWNSRGKTNRWAMFDEYNNTQTTNPEEIVIVLSPQSICEGLYLGNVEADEIELVVVDQAEGKVYSEVTSLVTASGSSSYYDWCFRSADRADYYFTVAMPPYAAALVTVVLRKPGGVAKCGMAAIGLVDDFGPSLYGLSASGKDFSSTTFNFDGTSKTQMRDYAKQMNVDVRVNNGEIDYIQRRLFQLRQRPIVWIGGPYGATAVFGRYVSFGIVIPGLLKSDMSLQIEGSV